MTCCPPRANPRALRVAPLASPRPDDTLKSCSARLRATIQAIRALRRHGAGRRVACRFTPMARSPISRRRTASSSSSPRTLTRACSAPPRTILAARSSGASARKDLLRILDGLDRIEGEAPVIQGRRDCSRIAVAGHSWGGQTASTLVRSPVGRVSAVRPWSVAWPDRGSGSGCQRGRVAASPAHGHRCRRSVGHRRRCSTRARSFAG